MRSGRRVLPSSHSEGMPDCLLWFGLVAGPVFRTVRRDRKPTWRRGSSRLRRGPDRSVIRGLPRLGYSRKSVRLLVIRSSSRTWQNCGRKLLRARSGHSCECLRQPGRRLSRPGHFATCNVIPVAARCLLYRQNAGSVHFVITWWTPRCASLAPSKHCAIPAVKPVTGSAESDSCVPAPSAAFVAGEESAGHSLPPDETSKNKVNSSNLLCEKLRECDENLRTRVGWGADTRPEFNG